MLPFEFGIFMFAEQKLKVPNELTPLLFNDIVDEIVGDDDCAEGEEFAVEGTANVGDDDDVAGIDDADDNGGDDCTKDWFCISPVW